MVQFFSFFWGGPPINRMNRILKTNQGLQHVLFVWYPSSEPLPFHALYQESLPKMVVTTIPLHHESLLKKKPGHTPKKRLGTVATKHRWNTRPPRRKEGPRTLTISCHTCHMPWVLLAFKSRSKIGSLLIQGPPG